MAQEALGIKDRHNNKPEFTNHLQETRLRNPNQSRRQYRQKRAGGGGEKNETEPA